MIIENSQVDLYSHTQSTFKHSKSTFSSLYYGQKTTVESNKQETTSQLSMIQYNRAIYHSEEHLKLEDRIKKILLETLIGRLKKTDPVSLYPKQYEHENNAPLITKLNPYTQHSQVAQEFKAIAIHTHEQYHQKQTVDFSSSVKIKTPNKTFEMGLDISFSKELYESRSTRLIIGDERFVDPLVINYGEEVNPFDNISQLRFAFDLDSDGDTEMIPQLKQGAGYLALDKNNNGEIDNGHELFGPNTGEGFKELAQYDEDNNHWIDENDAIFDKLKIWSIDESGNHTLVSLLDSNVGAIYLGDVQSGFKYQESIGKTDAVQKSNGIFVKEDGSGIGVVNSIDVVV